MHLHHAICLPWSMNNQENKIRLRSLGSSNKAHPGRPPFRPRFMPSVGPPIHEPGCYCAPPRCRPFRFPQVPFQYPRSRKAMLVQNHPNRSLIPNLHGPDCTLSLLPEKSRRPADDPVDSDPEIVPPNGTIPLQIRYVKRRNS